MPRCKHCKSKFEQYEFNGKFCKELDCQVQKGLFKLGKIKKQKKHLHALLFDILQKISADSSKDNAPCL